MDGKEYYDRGCANLESGKFADAISDLTKAIEFKPSSAGAYDRRATAYSCNGDSENAISDFTKAISLGDDDKSFCAVCYSNRGVLYAGKGDLKKAFDDFTEALRLNPNNAEAKGGLEQVKKDLQKIPEMERKIETFTKKIELEPKNVGAHLDRASAYHYIRNYEKSIQDYETAIALDRNCAYMAYKWIGIMHDEKGEYDLAIEKLTLSISADKNYADAYNARGTAYFHKNEYDLAIADFNKVLQLAPNDPDACAEARKGLEMAKNK